MKTTRIHSQPSWHLRSDKVDAWLTRLGGHLGPVRFRLGRRSVAPYAVAPWADEKLPAGLPPVLRALRGDFFCLPFGGPRPGETHPVHGYTAGATWRRPSLIREGPVLRFRAEMPSLQPAVQVTKEITLRDGHAAVYSRHTLAGGSGPVTFAHHPMLQFTDATGPGIISTSAVEFGQVRPGRVEDPTKAGYPSLQHGAVFKSLRKVPRLGGGFKDLTRYPGQLGYEDFVMLASRPVRPFAWTCVTFPQEKFAWFLLKDPRVLPSTLFWLSHGGLYGPLANGRLRGILGVEDIVGYFGLRGRQVPRSNPFAARGYPTQVILRPDQPLVVNVIAGVVAIPSGFGAVDSIEAAPGKIVLASGRHRAACPLDHEFLGAS